jgi:hypothetical protein
VEIGLLTAIAIRGRPVKGLSLADHASAASVSTRFDACSRVLRPGGGEVLIDVAKRPHPDQRACHSWQRTHERERSLRVRRE